MFIYRMIVYLVFGVKEVVVLVIPQNPDCQDPLGMQNGNIKDDQFQFTDSSHYPGKEPYKARLNGKSAYCTPTTQGSTEAWYSSIAFTIDLKDVYKITGFAIQGYGTQYGTGKYMKLYTSPNYAHEYIYKFNGSEVIKLRDVKGDNIEYLPLTPTFASTIKIKLIGSSNTHCLRMEIYGCISNSYNEYSECTSGHEAILSNYHQDMKFTETDAQKTGADRYDATWLVFSKSFAWCLMTASLSDTPFKDWATIDMAENYLIYSIQVRGFLQRTGDADKRKYIAKLFKFRYSLVHGVKKRDLEGRKELSTKTYGTKQTFKIPLIARYVYISMKNVGGNLTCIKLEMYGCKAILEDGFATTKKVPVIPTNNTNPDKARISRYHIFQGNRYTPDSGPEINWIDSKYDGKMDSKNELDEGIGCLVDKNTKENDNPFLSPECWIGWKLNLTNKPYIYIVLTRPTKVAGIRLRTYVNRSMKALPIRKFNVIASTHKPLLAIGSLCSPLLFYKEEATVIDYYISLDDIMLQYLQLELEYSGDWILVRQLEFIKPGDLVESALKLTKGITHECIVPKPAIAQKETAWQVTVIVIIVLVMLLLVLVAFIIHHYRTSMNKKWSTGREGRPSIIVQDQHSSHSDNRGFITSDPAGKGNYTKVQYTNNKKQKYNPISNVEEGIYDAVDDSFDSGVLSDPQQATYADCEDIRAELYSQQSSTHNTPNGTLLYSVPDTKIYAEPNVRQYAEPDSLKRESVIYQGSIIYATTYENPYRATVASTLYAEPSKLSKKGQIKVFPRQQLVFKEKIGVGQFGEVHIAEASGLDEIYGSIGHFNSWGLPDTSLVAVKLLKSVDSEVEQEFMKEVDVMATLKDENVVRLLGVCYEQPKLMVVEYMENGDLNQFLRERRPALGTHSRTSELGPNVLIVDQLIHMAQQISAGMKYLHSVGFIHRDLATRNCLVGPAYQVKIADFGMSRYVYTKHYYRVEGKAILPIRWMAPECIYYGKFTAETDVWSFGVTLWEIFSMARESPYVHMSDPQVIEVACEVLQNTKRTFPYLSQPQSCPDDVYELVKKCWTTHPKSRPNFTTLCAQLLQKCTISEVDI